VKIKEVKKKIKRSVKVKKNKKRLKRKTLTDEISVKLLERVKRLIKCSKKPENAWVLKKKSFIYSQLQTGSTMDSYRTSSTYTQLSPAK